MNIEEEDLGAALREEAELIGHIHVADSGRLQPGVGHLDWPGLLGALRDISYDGWLAMESGIKGDAHDALPRGREASAPTDVARAQLSLACRCFTSHRVLRSCRHLRLEPARTR